MNLILIRGLPGSGKSFMAREFTLLGYSHYEADQYYVKAGVYKFDGSKIKHAHEFCQEETRKALFRGENVVVSNTFTRIFEMDPYVTMAKAHDATLYIMKAYGEYKDVHGCPPETIAKMAARWEAV